MSDFAPVNPTPIQNPGKITVGMFPGDDHPVVLEAASTLGSSTDFRPVTSFTRVALKDGGYKHSMQYPIDGIRRYFRGRHQTAGWTAGAYTRTVSAIPRPATIGLSTDDGWEWIIGGLSDPAPLSEAIMKEEGVTRTTGQEVGTLASTATITKTLAISAANYVAQSSTAAWQRDADGLYINPTSTERTFFSAPVVLPPGVILTNMSGQYYRSTHVDDLSIVLTRSSDANTLPVTVAFADMFTTSSTETSWFTRSSAVDHTILADSQYYLHANIAMDSASSENVRVAAIELTYTMADYHEAY